MMLDASDEVFIFESTEHETCSPFSFSKISKISVEPKKVLIRCDASSTLGAGHLMRCLVLAKEFEDAEIFFASQNLEGNLNFLIKEAGYSLEILHGDSFKELSFVMKKLEIDFLVLDSYAIDFTFEKKIKKVFPQVKMMVLDDTYEKHYCDILLNHNIYAKKSRYKSLVPKGCDLRCGAKYTLLQEEFYSERENNQNRKAMKTKRVLLALGGADTKALTVPLLKMLATSTLHMEIVTTNANKNLSEILEYVKDKKRLHLHIQTKKMPQLIASCDFGIITPSTLANEFYFMQKPFIAIQTAKNQKYMYKYLKTQGYHVMKKLENKKFEQMFQSLLQGLE